MRNKIIYIFLGIAFVVFFIAGILITNKSTSVRNLLSTIPVLSKITSQETISTSSTVPGLTLTAVDKPALQSILNARKSPTDQLANVTKLQVELVNQNPEMYRTYAGTQLASAGSYDIQDSTLRIKIYLGDILLKDTGDQKNIEFSIKFLQLIAAASNKLEAQKPAGQVDTTTVSAVDSLMRVYLDKKDDGTITKSLFTIK